MSGKTYSISQVEEMLNIEAYVLRYYEKELKLDIHRNAQGHRIYDDQNIAMLRQIKDIREQGLELKALKNMIKNEGIEVFLNNGNNKKSVSEMLLPKEQEMITVNETEVADISDQFVEKFNFMIGNTVSHSVRETMIEMHAATKQEIKEELAGEMNLIVQKKIRELEVVHNEKNEDYYHKMDETMREMKRIQKELALLKEGQEKGGLIKRLFKSKANKKYESTLVSET